MSDIAKLQIRVESLEAQTASKRLNNLSKSGASAEKATSSLTSTFLKFAGPAAAVAAAIASLRKTVDVARTFDVLNAALITSTGSAEKAETAFKALADFADTTPYSLEQAVEGFNKLVNLGLTPSEEALTSYGNTASAMGKDLNQMIEAVADASTGEFERLKEFGIKASSEGDRVSFTFQGVTTNIGKNAAEIEQYLLGIGNNNFAGAMSQQMDTLNGDIAILENSWNALFLAVSDQGVGNVVREGVQLATDAINELTDIIASGQLEGYYQAFLAGWGGTLTGIADQFTALSTYIEETLNEWAKWAGISSDEMSNAFFNLPANIKAGFQIISIEIEAMIDKFDAFDRAFTAAINPFDDYSMDDAMAYYETRIEQINATVSRGYAAISSERKSAIDDVQTEIDKADALRTAYDKAQKSASANAGDRLAGFKLDSGDSSSSDEGDASVDSATAKRLARAKAAREAEFQSLVDSLKTEEEAIQSSYDRRLAIILSNTEEGSKQRADLKAKLDANFATQALDGFTTSDDSFQSQMELIQEQFEERRDLILENTQLTEEARTELEVELTKARNEQITALETERQQMLLSSSEDMFASLATVTGAFAGQQSSLYQGMFAVSKAFAIANSIIKIQQGIAEAASLPFPVNIPAMATVAASTASIVSTIEGTQVQGYKEGGYTGNVGTSDVAGVVHGQEFVFDAESTRRIGVGNLEAMRNGQSSSGSGSNSATTSQNPQTGVNQTNVRIVNSVDSSVMEQYMGSKKGEKVIMNVIKNNPSLVKSAVRG